MFPGDLIQAVNGRAVEDWDSLLDLVEALPIGGSADLDIERGGRRQRVRIRLEALRRSGVLRSDKENGHRRVYWFPQEG